jgi:hypothetical protein
VYTKGPLAQAQAYDGFCRSQQPPVPFVYAKTAGVFGQVFCDFGPEFVITDTDGAPHSQFLLGGLRSRVHSPLESMCEVCQTRSLRGCHACVSLCFLIATVHVLHVLNALSSVAGCTVPCPHVPLTTVFLNTDRLACAWQDAQQPQFSARHG